MREWGQFWRRSVVNGLRWGKTALDRASLLLAIVGVLFGVGFVLIPLTRHGTPRHPYQYHFPTFPFVIAALAALLIVLCHGAYVTWKEDADKADTVRTERDALLAAKIAPRALPPKHVEEMVGFLSTIEKTLVGGGLLFLAPTLGRESNYRDAIRVHYPAVHARWTEWERIRSQSGAADAIVSGLVRERVQALGSLGIPSTASQYVLDAIDHVVKGLHAIRSEWVPVARVDQTAWYWNNQELRGCADRRLMRTPTGPANRSAWP
jgi:hypothetical protein